MPTSPNRCFALRPITLCIVAVAVALSFAAPPVVTAMTLDFTDGRKVEAEIDEVVLDVAEPYVKVVLDTGERTSYKLRELTPLSVYHVRAHAITDNDPLAHVELGKYCVDHGLSQQAEFEFRAARDMARTIATDAHALLLATMETGAQSLSREATDLADRGYYEKALRLFLRIHQFYHHTSVGPAAAAKIKELQEKLGLPEELPDPVDPDARQNVVNNAGGGANPANPDADHQAMLEGLSRSERRDYDKVADTLQAAIDSLDKNEDLIDQLIAQYTGNGINSNDSRLAEGILFGDQGLDNARKLFRAVIDEPEDRKLYGTLIARARAALSRYETLMFRLALHMAHGYAQYNQTQQASIWVNRILAVSPDHEEARFLRRVITEKALLEKR